MQESELTLGGGAPIRGDRAATIVSAADGIYFRCLAQLLLSIERVDPKQTLQVIVYDLGLREVQRASLQRRFPRAELRRFELSAMPEFMRLRSRVLNSNAWKPQILDQVVAREAKGPVLWLDSATVLLKHPGRILAEVGRAGFYAPFGGHSSIARWTHPGTGAALGARHSQLTQRMRASGVVGIDPRNSLARSLLSHWAAACRDEQCVAPPGCQRSAHNFDQSVLNILLVAACREHGLRLSDDELDISSTRPVSELRSRNKVWSWLPLGLDPLVRAYYASYRAMDVAVLRYRRSRFCLPFARDVRAPAPW